MDITTEELDLIIENTKDHQDAELWIDQRFPSWLKPLILNRMKSAPSSIERSKVECEESLHEFVKQAWSVVEPDQDYVDGWHIRAICKHLEAVTAGSISHLLINVPPGHSKSLICSVFWPCWVWTHWPGSRWLFASYNDMLTLRDSKRKRDIFKSAWWIERWGETWPDTDHPGVFCFSGDENMKSRFSNNHGGTMISSTVGGLATGEHPHFIVVDDPHNVRKSQSFAERRYVIDWIDQTLGSRGVLVDSRRVMVMQRLHENDASAHVIEKGYWEHIMLPARYEPDHPFLMKGTSLGWVDERTEEGELLWPEAFTEKRLSFVERELGGGYASAGQLQQRPSKVGGNIIKHEWFRFFEMRGQLLRPMGPEGVIATIDERECRRYAYIDTAGTDKDVARESKGKPPSHTVCLIVDHWVEKGYVFARHISRGQWGWENITKEIPRALEKWGVERVFIENAHWGQELARFLKRNVTMLSHEGKSKLERSTHFQEKLEYGEFFIPADAVPWRRLYVDECVSWTGHPDDTADQIDVSSYACRDLVIKSVSWGGSLDVDKGQVPRYSRKGVW